MDDPKIYTIFSVTDDKCNEEISSSSTMIFGEGEALEELEISTSGQGLDTERIAGIYIKTNWG